MVADLEDLFGEEVAQLKMTSMADSLHALSCHNMTLPCSDKVTRAALLLCIGRDGIVLFCASHASELRTTFTFVVE